MLTESNDVIIYKGGGGDNLPWCVTVVPQGFSRPWRKKSGMCREIRKSGSRLGKLANKCKEEG